MVSLPWDEPGWLEGVRTWIENELARVGRPATGPIEILHRRAWSAFAQIPTDGGPIYFKASAPALLFEAGLTAALRRWHPELTLPPLAVDAERAWMLTADAGPTLRSQLHRPEDLRRLDPLLQRYAVLQGGLVRRVPEMLAMGVPDRRSERLPGLYDELLGDTSALRLGLDGGMTPEQHRRLKALRPRFADECAQLAEAGPPDTLVHEEIHSGNILVTPSGELLTDWGDSCLAHPFVSILVMLRSAAWWLDVPETHPEVQRLRDVYLEAWTSHAPRHALHAVLATAYRVAMVVRSLAYQAILGPLAESYRIENDAIQGWLVDYLESEEGGRAKEQ